MTESSKKRIGVFIVEIQLNHRGEGKI